MRSFKKKELGQMIQSFLAIEFFSVLGVRLTMDML